jgi:hypothetical protein
MTERGRIIGIGQNHDAIRANGDRMLSNTTTILMLLAVLLLYMLPTLIAYGREHPHRQDVALLNILLGWTLIGWIGVFLWASLAHVESEFG